MQIPGFISLNPASGTTAHFSSGFLPTRYQGTALGQTSRFAEDEGEQLQNIKNKYISKTLQSKQMDFIQKLNSNQYQKDRNTQVKGVIDSYEMAYKMQDSMPAILDICFAKPLANGGSLPNVFSVPNEKPAPVKRIAFPAPNLL